MRALPPWLTVGLRSIALSRGRRRSSGVRGRCVGIGPLLGVIQDPLHDRRVLAAGNQLEMAFDMKVINLSTRPKCKSIGVAELKDYMATVYLTDNLRDKYPLRSVNGTVVAPNETPVYAAWLFNKVGSVFYTYVFDRPPSGSSTLTLSDTPITFKGIRIKK